LFITITERGRAAFFAAPLLTKAFPFGGLKAISVQSDRIWNPIRAYQKVHLAHCFAASHCVVKG